VLSDGPAVLSKILILNGLVAPDGQIIRTAWGCWGVTMDVTRVTLRFIVY